MKSSPTRRLPQLCAYFHRCESFHVLLFSPLSSVFPSFCIFFRDLKGCFLKGKGGRRSCTEDLSDAKAIRAVRTTVLYTLFPMWRKFEWRVKKKPNTGCKIKVFALSVLYWNARSLPTFRTKPIVFLVTFHFFCLSAFHLASISPSRDSYSLAISSSAFQLSDFLIRTRLPPPSLCNINPLHFHNLSQLTYSSAEWDINVAWTSIEDWLHSLGSFDLHTRIFVFPRSVRMRSMTSLFVLVYRARSTQYFRGIYFFFIA